MKRLRSDSKTLKGPTGIIVYKQMQILDVILIFMDIKIPKMFLRTTRAQMLTDIGLQNLIAASLFVQFCSLQTRITILQMIINKPGYLI